MKRLSLAMAVLGMVACSDDEGPANTNTNNTTNTNNATNNASNNSNNASNNTTNNSNNTTNNSTNNVTTGNNGNCVELDPSLGACDPICQTGCGTQNCVARQADAAEPPVAACVAAGTQSSGACTTDADCAIGHMCLSVEGADPVCLQYCRPGRPAESGCDAGLDCRPFQLELRLGVCTSANDECGFFPDGCDDGENCYDTPNGTRCATYNAEAQPDAACTNSNECNDGYRCVGINGGATACKRMCDPNEPVCETGTCQRMNGSDGSPLAWGACL
ncbi:MAG: hypothetical protein R3E66_15225 [bacterium]